MCKNKIIKAIASLFLLCMLPPLFTNENTSIIVANTKPAYTLSLKESSPNLTIIECDFSNSLRVFEDGKNVATYATAAIPLANIHPDYAFTPHFVETVIIAIDRSQTLEAVTGWKDLLNSTSPISFSFGKAIGEMVWNTPENYHIITAMAKALYGTYDIASIAQDFRKLNKSGRFFTNDTTKPISVMYDSDAVRLIQEGRNLEIIFPKEGTLSFVMGILHKNDITINKAELDQALINNAFRLLDGSANASYPPNELYSGAEIVDNYTEYNSAVVTIDSIMRRDSFDVKRYGFANTKERTIGYILCIIAVILYLVSILQRVTQKNIRNSLIIMCVLELLLATTQHIKSILSANPNLETFLWYAFYFPFVLIPVFFVYVAVVTGKQGRKDVPLAYKIYFVLSFLPIIFVATNNLHQQVFEVYDYYHTYFYYNWGYYVVMAWIYGSIAFALTLLIIKAFQNPRKWAFVLPILASIITLLYTIGVILRVPIARDFEVGYATGIALLLFTEACIQSRLFPINRGYKRLFSKSSLWMEIHDIKDALVLRSDNERIIDNNYVLRKSPIPGGSFLFYENYTLLNNTKNELAIKNQLLKNNNLVLKEKTKIDADLAALSVQKEVYKSIDKTLKRDTKKISTLLELMKDNNNTAAIITNINIIACGIKRECILKINSLYTPWMNVYDFLTYIKEMKDYSIGAELQITLGSDIEGEIPSSQGLLMYEFFRLILEEATNLHCNTMLVQLYCDKDKLVFSLITDKDTSHTIDPKKLHQKAKALGGTFEIKPWDDTNSFLLSLQRGERIV